MKVGRPIKSKLWSEKIADARSEILARIGRKRGVQVNHEIVVTPRGRNAGRRHVVTASVPSVDGAAKIARQVLREVFPTFEKATVSEGEVRTVKALT
jgi:hypothetical protein